MNYNLESFCPEAWSQLEIDAQGDYKVCCLANYDRDFGMARDADNKVLNVMTHSIEEAMNSETHKNHRKELSQNKKPLRCLNCYDSEYAKQSGPNKELKMPASKRQRVIQITAVDNNEYITVETAKDVTLEDGTLLNPKVINLDLRFGNLCNQKCLMCSPQHSNQWYEDWVAITGSNIFVQKKKEFIIHQDDKGRYRMGGFEPWWESDRWWEMFDKIAPQLRYIYFTGGEPLLVPQMQECLDKLIERGFSHNIQLRYDTNLSVINKKVIDKWRHFKDVFLCVSIDEIGERYNLVRNMGNFETFENNLIKIRENNIRISYLSTCIGMSTIYSVQRVHEFCKKYNIKEQLYRFLDGPDWLNVRHLPRSAKEEIIKNLTAYSSEPEYLKYAMAEVRLLEKYIDHVNLNHIKDFIDKMDILDNKRNTNWRQTLPDVADLLKRHCPDIYVEK
jgi:organic radical activating enzyme